MISSVRARGRFTLKGVSPLLRTSTMTREKLSTKQESSMLPEPGVLLAVARRTGGNFRDNPREFVKHAELITKQDFDQSQLRLTEELEFCLVARECINDLGWDAVLAHLFSYRYFMEGNPLIGVLGKILVLIAMDEAALNVANQWRELAFSARNVKVPALTFFQAILRTTKTLEDESTARMIGTLTNLFKDSAMSALFFNRVDLNLGSTQVELYEQFKKGAILDISSLTPPTCVIPVKLSNTESKGMGSIIMQFVTIDSRQSLEKYLQSVKELPHVPQIPQTDISCIIIINLASSGFGTDSIVEQYWVENGRVPCFILTGLMSNMEREVVQWFDRVKSFLKPTR